MDEKKEKLKMNMSDRRIWVSIQQTTQLKQYCPLQICVGMSADISDEQKDEKEYKKILLKLRKQIQTGFEIMSEEED